MRLYLVKTPKIIKQIFSNYIWSFFTPNSSQKTIYLTFDDGPTPEITIWVLDLLKQFNAKATFFCIGENVKRYPTIYNRLITEGHAVGNHTYNHLNGWKTKFKDYIENTSIAKNYIESNLFRPPYGKITNKQGKALLKNGYKIIMWDVLSGDFDKSQTAEKCWNNVLNNTVDESIIVFHDSIKAEHKMKYALEKTLIHFSKKDFQFNKLH